MKEIIKKLANKEQTVGCKAIDNSGDIWVMVGIKFGWWCKYGGLETQRDSSVFKEILGHPIYIGDVLERIYRTDSSFENENDLIFFWSFCGLSKSLQEIEAGSGYELWFTEEKDPDALGNMTTERLKDPKARALADFIKTII